MSWIGWMVGLNNNNRIKCLLNNDEAGRRTGDTDQNKFQDIYIHTYVKCLLNKLKQHNFVSVLCLNDQTYLGHSKRCVSKHSWLSVHKFRYIHRGKSCTNRLQPHFTLFLDISLASQPHFTLFLDIL